MKQFICVIIAIAAIFCGTAFAAEVKVGESTELILYYNEETHNISIKDKRTGEVWESALDAEKLSRKPNKLWGDRIKSLCFISYVDKNSTRGDIISTNNAEANAKISHKVSNNKLTLSIDFEKEKLSFDIVIKLDGDSVLVTVPFESVKEYGDNYIVSMELLPFLGATLDTDKGYYLYPNGSGELYNFRDVKLRGSAVKDYSLPIYSMHDFIMRDYIQGSNLNVMLPVYGVKKGSSAFAAIIEQGDCDAAININPGGTSISANRIFATLYYRYSYSVQGSEIRVSGSGYFPLALLFDVEPAPGDRSIRYCFLAGDKANYSGMAEAVRKNLVERKLLPNKKNDDEMPILLDYFMGVTTKRMMFDFFIKATTFAQGEDMTRYFYDSGIRNATINIKGYSPKGYFAKGGAYKAAGDLGGASALKKLTQACTESGYKAIAENDLALIEDGTTNYSQIADTARDPNGFVYAFDKFKLFSPTISSTRNDTLVKELDKLGFGGIAYGTSGWLIYTDNRKGSQSNRRQTADTWNNLMATSKQKLGTAAVWGGNLYALQNADIAIAIPEQGGSVMLGDETVPFLQMVLHGHVSYAGQPINLYYDKRAQTLKLIEYGYMPYYELTYDQSSKLRETAYNQLYTSRFEEWKDDVTKLYAELSQNLKGTWNQAITSHEKLQNKLYAVTYESGTVIYVNYNNYAVTLGGIKIEAMSYKVEGGRR